MAPSSYRAEILLVRSSTLPQGVEVPGPCCLSDNLDSSDDGRPAFQLYPLELHSFLVNTENATPPSCSLDFWQ